MIAEALAFLLGMPAPAVEQPRAVEVRYRRRARKPAGVPFQPDADLSPHKTKTYRVTIGENGKWVVDRGIEDVYSRVPPFNRSP